MASTEEHRSLHYSKSNCAYALFFLPFVSLSAAAGGAVRLLSMTGLPIVYLAAHLKIGNHCTSLALIESWSWNSNSSQHLAANFNVLNGANACFLR